MPKTLEIHGQAETLGCMVGDFRQKTRRSSVQRLVEQVYGHVVENIFCGKYLPGAKITEAMVAEELGTSRIPVREAMEKLHHEGWIERIPNRGAFVKELNIEDIKNLFQIREIHETAAVRAIAKDITDTQLEELERVLDVLNSAVEARDIKLIRDAEIHFHRLLVHFMGNSRLDTIFESVLLQARLFFTFSHELPFFSKEFKRRLDKASHFQIYKALKAHQQGKVERLIREHMRIGLESCIRIQELAHSLAKKTI